MLNEEHAQLRNQPKHDENCYILGSIAGHNVTITCLPEIGNNRAAIAAKSMQSTFPNLRFWLLVGVGGGIPSPKNDIRLGDIIVSKPTELGGGVIQYDLGKAETDGFRRLGTLNKPPTLLRSAIANLMSTRGLGKEISRLVGNTFLNGELDDDESEDEWTYPKMVKDILFSADFRHVGDSSDCDACVATASERNGLVKRDSRTSTNPRLYYGNIASGNSVMKDADQRDRLAGRDNVLCFEMEAAGLMDDFPCLVIRGISDYADSHKNDKWQPYASAVAAAYARKLLTKVAPEAVKSLEPAVSSSPHVCIGTIALPSTSIPHFVVNNYDYSVVKVPAPTEFQAFGQFLTPSRREKAEDGILHVTARRLGAIFETMLPHTPELIRCYGLRASEIARDSSADVPQGAGMFSKQAGIDGASIWAGATSGAGAIQVHLLACVLAMMWSGPEATSIWSELLECRRLEIQKKFDENGSVPIGTMIAMRNQLDRSQLAEWDASARAWLRIADTAKKVQQRRLLHTIGTVNKLVNSKPVLYESVINAWKAGLEGVEALLQGSPMEIQSGDVFPALCSWHIYPDLNILGSRSKISQDDHLVPPSSILTINPHNYGVLQDKGLRWSLPLAHLRYYGDPVHCISTIAAEGSRLSLEEFSIVVLGCVLGGWNIADHGVDDALKWLHMLSAKLLSFFDKKDPIFKMESWLQILGNTAGTFLESNDLDRSQFTQLLNLGRNHSSLLGTPSQPFFGLSDTNRAVLLSSGATKKIELLRSQAALARLPWNHAIIRYVSAETEQEEYASASPLERDVPKRSAETGEKRPNVRHVRWVRSKPLQGVHDTEELGRPVMEDVFWGPAINTDDVLLASAEINTNNGTEAITPQPIPVRRVHDQSKVFALQQQRYRDIGEDVLPVEEDHIITVAPAGKSMRVIWGFLGMTPTTMWDTYEPWFGEMKHYEYWLGDPKSAAIFIRMDQLKPADRTHVNFSDLQSVFGPDNLDSSALPLVFADALQCLEPTYLQSLRSFSTMYALYRHLKQATIDVRVLEQPLACATWFDSVRNKPVDNTQPANEPLDQDDDESEDDSNASGEFADKFICEAVSPIVDEIAVFAVPTTGLENTPKSRLTSKTTALNTITQSLKPWTMTLTESFSCILLFENVFHILPSQLRNVMAISSCNSLFIASSLISDPASSPRKANVQHIMGNVGRPGTALLLPPVAPRNISKNIQRWPLIQLGSWDGIPKDSFLDSSLHLSFTGSTQEVDTGYSGAQDKELYILESVVSLHGMGEWIADLDIVKALQDPPLVYRHRQKRIPRSLPGTAASKTRCADGHEVQYQYERLPLAAVENWAELVEETNKDRIFLAANNWQARLAATMICIAQGKAVCLLPNSVVDARGTPNINLSHPYEIRQKAYGVNRLY
ncbi:hypothetical protein DL767_003825 [Monosporascus sp. MG133]|nr:hypothetical protein DL767_003825 [Monosporascus sp. MG133]